MCDAKISLNSVIIEAICFDLWNHARQLSNGRDSRAVLCCYWLTVADNTAVGQQPIHGPACGVQCGGRYREFCRNRVFRVFPPREETLGGEYLDHV